MHVQVVYFDGCPSWQVALRRLNAALAETGHPDAVVDLVPISSAERPDANRFAGSPTLLVDGRDLFPGTDPISDLACRVYPSPHGLSGSPTYEALVAALATISATAVAWKMRDQAALQRG
jgi:hypothetical protein